MQVGARRLHAAAWSAPATRSMPTLYDKLSFNFIRDIAPVAGIVRVAQRRWRSIPRFPAKTVPEFIAYAKANPGKINMASAGNGTARTSGRRAVQDDDRRRHAARALSRRGPALTDLLGGQVQVMFDDHAIVDRVHPGRQAARAGGDHAKRSDALPDMPTVGDFVPGYEASAWYGIGAPKARPPRSSTASTRDQCRPRRSEASRRGSPTWAARRLPARPPSSASSSRTKPRSGAR